MIKKIYSTLALITSIVIMYSSAIAQEKQSSNFTLITNVNVWDGTSEKLIKADVLIENNLIKEVSDKITAPKEAIVIDGKGGTLMPGLIDSHVHFAMNGSGLADIENNKTWKTSPSVRLPWRRCTLWKALPRSETWVGLMVA